MARPRSRTEEAPARPQAVVGAARRIPLNNGKALKQWVTKSKDWQTEAWAYYDEVGEIKQAMRFSGDCISKVRLFVGVRPADEPDAEPVPVLDEASGVPPEVARRCVAELARLKSPIGGQPALLKRLNQNVDIPGECYLVGRAERAEVPALDGKPAREATPEEWVVASTDEIQLKNGRVYFTDDNGKAIGDPLDPDLDTVIRIWQQHPRRAAMPDSAMRGILGDCRALQLLSQAVIAEAMSRLPSGLLKWPNGLTVVGGAADEDGVPIPVAEQLDLLLTAPIDDPTSPIAVAPVVVTGEVEALKGLDLLRLGREADSTLDQRIEARIRRIARGLNLPVEVIEGLMQTTFANAGQVDEDTFEDYIQPRVVFICDVLTIGFLRPNLAEPMPGEGPVPPELLDRLVVWFDASDLVTQPDQEANADAGHANFTISDRAWRKAKGFSEEDAPDPLEIVVRAGLRRGILTAELTAALMAPLAEEAGVELPSPPEAVGDQPPAEGQLAALASLLTMVARARTTRAGGRPVVAAVAAARRTEYGAQLVAIDRDLRTRLTVAASEAMGRALERAGNRLRTKNNPYRGQLRGVDAFHVAATLGPSVVTAAAADDALDGAWADLERQFMAWGEQAQAEAIDLASVIAAGFTDAQRRDLKLRQAEDLAEAWAWLREALTALAGERLFDPDPAAPDVGEFDPNLRVPPGTLREALARAGGASGVVVENGAVLVDAGTRPAGGIATGELIRSALRDEGVGVEGYRWVYGPALRARPFEPHRRLDGVEFVNFDDDQLRNGRGFPPFAYYLPGDHRGCICDVEPIIIAPS